LPAPETGASIFVSDDLQNEYYFSEVEPGVYRSFNDFAIQPERTYLLTVETADGSSYNSEPARMISGNRIDRLYAERSSYQGNDGMALLVESRNPETASKFYRYEYSETYKIVSPFRVSSNLISEDGESYTIVPNTRDETICYNTVPSNRIILSNTSGLRENTSGSFLVRFIDAEDPVLGQRYSILVRQYSLTSAAYTYFATLEKISGSESIFSQNQPGFIQGNLFSVDDESEKVIGFFSLSSVSEERIFFNYTDFYTLAGNRPQFAQGCAIFRPGELIITPVSMILQGNFRYVGMAGAPTSEGEGPMRLIANECVDCTVFGTNEVPDFWEE